MSWGRSAFVYYAGHAAERHALIARLVGRRSQAGKRLDRHFCERSVADLPMVTRRLARWLPPIEQQWAAEDAAGLYGGRAKPKPAKRPRAAKR